MAGLASSTLFRVQPRASASPGNQSAEARRRPVPSRSTELLFEVHHDRLDVLTPRTSEGAEIEAWLLRLNTRQIHLRRAFWALWSHVNRRIFKRVFGKRHLQLLLFAGGSAIELSATDA
jgi:hypothetical protein